MTEKRAIPEIVPDTRVLVGRLERLTPGETVAYSELDALLGRSVQASARHNLDSARRIVERDRGMVTEAVRGHGIKRLEGSHLPDVADSAIASMRRKAKRTSRRMLRAAASEVLDNNTSIRVNARASMLGAIAMCATTKKVAQLEGNVRDASDGKTLPLGKTLDLFKK